MPSPAPVPEFASLAALNGALRAGTVTARQLVRKAARALEDEAKPGGRVRALLDGEAGRAARDVDRELKRGRTRGLLQGAPFVLAETVSLAGRRPFWDPDAPNCRVEDAAVVSRLRRARALPVAVAASAPLGGLIEGLDAAESGCAQLVAGQLAPFAIAVDFNGNVLRGALAAGCCALRPTFGLASGFGIAPLGWTLATASVLGRNAEDCGLVLAGLSGGDTRGPHSPGRAFHYAPQYARKPEQIRVAVAPGGEPIAAALDALRVAIAEFPAPDLPASAILETILAAEAGQACEDLLANEAAARLWLADARSLAAFDYLHAMRLRRMIQDWLADAATRADVWVLPWQPHAHESAASSALAGSDCLFCQSVSAAVLAGAPIFAAAGPGAPRFCAIARPGGENTLLRLAAALEPLTLHPPPGRF